MQTALSMKPSGSTDGAPIKIVATATAGTLFHTGQSGTTSGSEDDVWMWLTNTSSSDVIVTIEFGGATAPDFNIVHTVPAKGTIQAIPGIPIQNSKTVRAFADSANVVNMFGRIVRKTAA